MPFRSPHIPQPTYRSTPQTDTHRHSIPPGGLTPPPEPPKERESLRSIVSTVLILITAPLIALLLTAFVFQSYQVDGPSMEQTLHNNDRLIVLKIGRTWSRLTKQPYIPQRGEIIVFVKHDIYQYDQNHDKQLIKRVVGLPGDRVVVTDGTLTIYNSEHRDGFQPDKTLGYKDSITQTTSGNVDLVVPAGEVFAVGDNRSNSLDSRSFGTVPANDIVGQLVVRILPASDITLF